MTGNPYESPDAALPSPDAAKKSDDASDVKPKPKRSFGHALMTTLGVASLLHFALSSFIWIRTGYAFYNFEDGFDGLPHYVWLASPAILLLASSIVLLVALHRNWRRPVLFTMLHFAAVFSCFAYDAYYHRYQMGVGIATTEYWENGGRRHWYYTWWWYNDRWIDG